MLINDDGSIDGTEAQIAKATEKYKAMAHDELAVELAKIDIAVTQLVAIEMFRMMEPPPNEDGNEREIVMFRVVRDKTIEDLRKAMIEPYAKPELRESFIAGVRDGLAMRHEKFASFCAQMHELIDVSVKAGIGSTREAFTARKAAFEVPARALLESVADGEDVSGVLGELTRMVANGNVIKAHHRINDAFGVTMSNLRFPRATPVIWFVILAAICSAVIASGYFVVERGVAGRPFESVAAAGCVIVFSLAAWGWTAPKDPW